MTRCWYIIDAAGWRRIDVAPKRKGEKRWDFWSDFRGDGPGDTAWPAFTQVVARAPAAAVCGAIAELAAELEIECTDVSDQPDQWHDALMLNEQDLGAGESLTLLSEPGTDFDARLLDPDTAERIFEKLGVDGAFFGHDPEAGTLMLSIYHQGNLVLSWSDSIQPGPSHALTFYPDGRATAEDPRPFALRRLGQEPTSPFLDRYAFVAHELAKFGLDEISPLLTNRTINAALRLSSENVRHLG